MFKRLLLIIFIAFTTSLFAYDKPNSIAYYPSAKAYFISNLAGKTITKLDSNYDKTDIITGQEVMMENLSKSNEININRLVPGIYLVRVNFENKFYNTTFIKQ